MCIIGSSRDKVSRIIERLLLVIESKHYNQVVAKKYAVSLAESHSSDDRRGIDNVLMCAPNGTHVSVTNIEVVLLTDKLSVDLI